jgi:hypothetical protein
MKTKVVDATPGELPPTMTVPQAGKHFFGIGRFASYQAAKRGELITIQIGRHLRVPVLAQQRKLEKAGQP